MSKTGRLAAAVGVALSATLVVGVTGGTAEAAPVRFANCTAMHKYYGHGVSKSQTAAMKQVRAGYGKPVVKSRVYWANANSDRDKDGTACEA